MGILDDLYGLNAQPPALFNAQTGFSPGLLGNVALGLISAGTTPQRVPQSSLNTILGGVAQGVTNYGNQLVANRQLQQQNLTNYLKFQKDQLEMEKLRSEIERQRQFSQFAQSLMPGSMTGNKVDPAVAVAAMGGDVGDLSEALSAQQDREARKIEVKGQPGRKAEETTLQETSKLIVEAKDKYPRVYQSYEYTTKTIDDILNNPNLDNVLGKNKNFVKLKTMFRPGTEEANVMNLIQQLEGQAFINAFQDLKGGGSVQLAEGEKATQSLLRGGIDQTPASFRKALMDLKEEIRKTKEMAGLRAGYKNLPTNATPYGYMPNDDRPYISINNEIIAMPSPTAIYQGMRQVQKGNETVNEYIFNDKGQTIAVTAD